MKVAKATQKPGQTKEQTKLIAQGIEKGIAEYKKRHSKKLREQDKQRKKQIKQREKTAAEEEQATAEPSSTPAAFQPLPWILLALSWLGFIGYAVWF